MQWYRTSCPLIKFIPYDLIIYPHTINLNCTLMILLEENVLSGIMNSYLSWRLPKSLHQTNCILSNIWLSLNLVREPRFLKWCFYHVTWSLFSFDLLTLEAGEWVMLGLHVRCVWKDVWKFMTENWAKKIVESWKYRWDIWMCHFAVVCLVSEPLSVNVRTRLTSLFLFLWKLYLKIHY